MSAIITPSNDLLATMAKVTDAASPFTTFATGHFVRPAPTAQPTAPAFTFGLFELSMAAPLDLDYDEPNAVCDADLEVVQAASVHRVQVDVVGPMPASACEPIRQSVAA